MKQSLLILSIISSIFLGCTTQTKKSGIWTYDNISPSSEYSYTIPQKAPPRFKKHLQLALAFWNHHLGEKKLLWTDSEQADVKVLYKQISQIEEQKSHTELLGCMNHLKGAIDCNIIINYPSTKLIMSSLSKLSHLYKKGPLDKILVKHFSYENNGVQFFQDKLILISLIHEVGHSLGLGHADHDGCLMAARPEGDIGLCQEELQAARSMLNMAN